MEPRSNDPRVYIKVLDIMNNFLYPSNSKIYEKEPQHDETLLKLKNFGTRFTLCYIKVPLHVLNAVTGTDCLRGTS